MESPAKSAYTRGAIYGLAAVCIWGAFIVVSRLGVRTSLTPWDVAAIRFSVAGVLLLPYLKKRGLALDRLGWKGVAAVVAGCGAPMVLLVNAGLLFAPAAHGGALFPGVMPLMVAILASIVLKEPFHIRRKTGCVLIGLGAAGIVWEAAARLERRRISATHCFLSRASRGPATLSPCGARGLMASTPPPSQRSDRWYFTCPSMPTSPGPVFSEPLCLISDCRRLFRAS